ncbi:MAG TPA: Sbal_3080 family lipoprotein, partial [Oxalicibacterium sp.]|uniref:Sbal_3080 family lipoprotein n=1 Tax=Oxalicibacterium sp. TaxID=2766525 RepID=UPI002BEF97C0
PAVKNSFVESYKRALIQKGYEVKLLPANASLIECPITSTYTANWQWDLALYMAYAQVIVYNNAKPVGSASYDARRGGGNMNKFIDADKKIHELVNQLFPSGAGS